MLFPKSVSHGIVLSHPEHVIQGESHGTNPLNAIGIVLTRVANLIQDAHGFRFFTDNRLHWSVHFTRPFGSFFSMLAQILQDSIQQFTKRVDLLRTQTLYRASTHPRRTLHSRLAEFLRTLIEANQVSTAV